MAEQRRTARRAGRQAVKRGCSLGACRRKVAWCRSGPVQAAPRSRRCRTRVLTVQRRALAGDEGLRGVVLACSGSSSSSFLSPFFLPLAWCGLAGASSCACGRCDAGQQAGAAALPVLGSSWVALQRGGRGLRDEEGPLDGEGLVSQRCVSTFAVRVVEQCSLVLVAT